MHFLIGSYNTHNGILGYSDVHNLMLDAMEIEHVCQRWKTKINNHQPSLIAIKLNSPVGLKRKPLAALNKCKASLPTDGEKASLRTLQSILAKSSVEA